MKKALLSMAAGLSAFLFVACELETVSSDSSDLPKVSPAGHLVINEVFTLPLDHPTPYSWIEFYNPTADTIDLTNWTLSLTTFSANAVFTVSIDSAGNFVAFGQTVVPDSFGVFDVPFAGGVFDIPGFEEDTVEILPGGLYTIVNSEDRLEDHTKWGPGDERFRSEKGGFEGPIETVTIIDSTDTLITIQATAKFYGFFLQPTDQLVLKDPAGNVVDVVRYGGYVYSGLTDPYLGNLSTGPLPEFESIQRYAGAYFTGNTASDFYVSSSSVIPTPHWYSQLRKR